MKNSKSSNLSTLLNAQEPLFSLTLRQLEKVSGRGSQDVKLQAEIIEKSHQAIKMLDLDPTDTTGPELYGALLSKAKEHDEHLANQLGIDDPTDVEQAVEKVVAKVAEVDMERECWALKKSVAKDFLRQTPPKKIMDRLGYRSVDSMLKQEDIFELFCALRFAEDGEWLNEFNKHYKNLKPSDFETREIELVVMPKERWGEVTEHFVEKKRHLNTHSKEMGAVCILPAKDSHMAGITTKLMSLTFHYYNEVRLYSSFFKLKQVQPDFGQIVVDTLIADPGNAAVMAGQNVHWRVIQRYFGKLKDEYHPEIFQPHVQPEDLHWRRAEEIMYQVAPELEFWKEMDHIGLMFDGRPVTFNLMDVSLSYSNDIKYEDRYIYHFREALWNEIFIRYMGQGTLEDQILIQLDNNMIKPEDLEYNETSNESS